MKNTTLLMLDNDIRPICKLLAKKEGVSVDDFVNKALRDHLKLGEYVEYANIEEEDAENNIPKGFFEWADKNIKLGEVYLSNEVYERLERAGIPIAMYRRLALPRVRKMIVFYSYKKKLLISFTTRRGQVAFYLSEIDRTKHRLI